MAVNIDHRKSLGAYYTDQVVADFLVAWAVRSPTDLVMDPSFGGCVFLESACRRISDLGGRPIGQVFGVELDASVHASGTESLKRQFGIGDAQIVHSDFFDLGPGARMVDAVVGNPPFIRYQRFSGPSRKRALRCALSQGVKLSELSSSWAPFLVHAASMVRPDGRLGMVVPFEICHARYARPVLEFLASAFGRVTLLTFKERLFSKLSEDTLLVLAEEKGRDSTAFGWRDVGSRRDLTDLLNGRLPWGIDGVSALDHRALSRGEERLIKYFLPPRARGLYDKLAELPEIRRLGDIAEVGIGYVSGANDFFHLSPAEAKLWGIPRRFLKPAVRRGRALAGLCFTRDDWRESLPSGQTGYLLHVAHAAGAEKELRRYLAEGERRGVPQAFKCRSRSPWYCVPHVGVPDAFLSYMSGETPKLVANAARAVAPNNLHMVRLRPLAGLTGPHLAVLWQNSFSRLSAEIEGHPLGGGMLKLEPSEARNVLLPVLPAGEVPDLLAELDGLHRQGRTDEARALADERMLGAHLGLSQEQCRLLREAAEALFDRRYRRRNGKAHAS